MRTETEWNIDRTECRWLVYQDEELVDVTTWTVLRPYAIEPAGTHPIVRALVVPLGLLILELVTLFVLKALS